jgi:hypothetical protein
MTKSDVTADDISQALHDGVCKRRDGLRISSHYCEGCLVMSAYSQSAWLESKRLVTARLRAHDLEREANRLGRGE